jgi:hypothetical protein
LYHPENAVPVIVAMSAERVALVPVVGIHEVAKDPASRLAFVTLPLTVSVRVPAVGVKVNDTRALAPVPTSGPAVEVPDRVTVPVP